MPVKKQNWVIPLVSYALRNKAENKRNFSLEFEDQDLSRLTLTERKNIFLNRLASPGGKMIYKRYLGSPIRYAGGKSLAVGHIINLLPKSVKNIVSPFIGGGSVEIALAKELGLEVKAFDIFNELVSYWQVQIKQPQALFDRLSKMEPTQELYNTIKCELKAHWKGEKKLQPFELAVHYYFNHNLSYGPGFLGWMSKIYKDTHRYYLMLEKVKNFSAGNLSVKCASFEKVIPKYGDSFLYCDPPYFLEGDSKMFRGIYPQRNFPIHHNGFKHEGLRDLLRRHKGGFILSYNDCSTIRAWYADCEIIDVSWQYTMGQGETRIGFNRINENRDHVKKSHEILIVKHA